MTTSGLAKLWIDASAHDLTVASAIGNAIDPIRELGLELEQRQYNTRLKALMHPTDYANDRKAAFNIMIEQVQKSYTDAYKGFIDAGLPINMAKQYALAAADNEKRVRRQVIETQFPTNANLIGDMSAVSESKTSVMNAMPGNMGGRARKPATRRRKPARRR